MTTTILEREELVLPQPVEEEDDPPHLTCCSPPQLAMCGAYNAEHDHSEGVWDGQSDDVCQDCKEIALNKCLYCGTGYYELCIHDRAGKPCPHDID